MINWIKRLFHLHEYEVIENMKSEVQIDTPNGNYSIVNRISIIQRCKHCGKIKVDKIRL